MSAKTPSLMPEASGNVNANCFKKPTQKLDAENVFLTKSEPHGRIVPSKEFHKLYVCENELDSIDEPLEISMSTNKEDIKKSKIRNVRSISKLENGLMTKKLDAISKLAYNLLKLSNCEHSVIINRNRNEIVRSEKNTNKKTIYRFINDEDLGVQPAEIISNESTSEEKPIDKCVKKFGRPKKRPMEMNKESETVSGEILSRSVVKKQKEEFDTRKPTVSETSTAVLSRFGRVIKTVKKDLSLQSSTIPHAINNVDSTRNLIADLNDKDYTCNLKTKATVHEPINAGELSTISLASSSPTKRHVPPEAVCPTCKKIFLGRRLKRHFVQHPDHMKPATPQAINTTSNVIQDDSLFRFLVSKLQKSNLNEDQRADLFLHEINDLVEQLQLRSSRLIRNTSGLHFVSARTARVLGIPEGQYALDMSTIDAPPEPDASCLLNFDANALPVPSNNTRSLDYTALSLDDTLTDEAAQKLNLSAGGKLLPPSEESLLRAVDDLVPPTGISKLVVTTNLLSRPENTVSKTSGTGESLVSHYDSDNAVEAVSMKECNGNTQAKPLLDLSVDFFQFNTS